MSIWPAICLFLCVASGCRDNTENIINQQATILLTVRTPTANIPRTQTRNTETPEETRISDVKVLVLTDLQGNGVYTYDYMVDGTHVVYHPDQSSRFQILLRSSSIPIKLLIIANSTNSFTNYSPVIGDNEESIKQSIIMNYPQDGITADFPMFGEVSLTSLDAVSTNTLEVTVLRAIARVDIVKNLTAGTRGFELREVYLYRVNNSIRVIPDNILINGSVRVNTPTIPTSSNPLSQPLMKTSETATDSIGGLYIPESSGFSGMEEGWQTATTVVVGGISEGDDQITYHRADFNSGVEGHPFGQVLRNFLYTFTIHKVSGPGWPTPIEAATNMATSMTVEIQQWEDFTTDMYFHQDYLGVSTREVRVPFLPNYTQTVDVQSSMQYEMQWLDSPEAGSVSETDVSLSNGYFTATIVRNAEDPLTISHLRIESPQYNITADTLQSTLRLTAFDTSVDITITKESSSQYLYKPIRVLGMGYGYGSLGNFDYPGPVALPMRNILDTQFSPTSSYSFKTGGFFFMIVAASSASYTYASTPANIASFKRMLNSFDVLMLPYQNYTSSQVANMILYEWLVENPHRVLWVMRDDVISNVEVLKLTAQDGEGVWNNIGDAFDLASGYRYSNENDYVYNNSEEVYEFFNGPFGTIDNAPGQQILFSVDNVAGASLISDTAKQYVTPLIYSNKPGYTDYMTMGVNKRRGIIYQGESQLFQYNFAMSPAANSNGTISSTPSTNGKYYYDVLMSNVWAWVTGRVIYGPPQE